MLRAHAAPPSTGLQGISVRPLVPDHHDHAVRAECRGRPDLRNLAGEEVVELPHGVVRPAEVVAVLAVVRDDHVESPDVPRREQSVEEAHVVRSGRPGGEHWMSSK
jgi:hypothetical protein